MVLRSEKSIFRPFGTKAKQDSRQVYLYEIEINLKKCTDKVRYIFMRIS